MINQQQKRLNEVFKRLEDEKCDPKDWFVLQGEFQNLHDAECKSAQGLLAKQALEEMKRKVAKIAKIHLNRLTVQSLHTEHQNLKSRMRLLNDLLKDEPASNSDIQECIDKCDSIVQRVRTFLDGGGIIVGAEERKLIQKVYQTLEQYDKLCGAVKARGIAVKRQASADSDSTPTSTGVRKQRVLPESDSAPRQTNNTNQGLQIHAPCATQFVRHIITEDDLNGEEVQHLTDLHRNIQVVKSIQQEIGKETLAQDHFIDEIQVRQEATEAQIIAANQELNAAYELKQKSRFMKFVAAFGKIGAFLGFARGGSAASTTVGGVVGAVAGGAAGTLLLDQGKVPDEALK